MYRQYSTDDKPRLLSRDCIARVQGSWANRIFLPRIEIVEASTTHLRRHFIIIMYSNVNLAIRGRTLEFEVDYKNKVVFYMAEVIFIVFFKHGNMSFTWDMKQCETEDACHELHDIIEELRREEMSKGKR